MPDAVALHLRAPVPDDAGRIAALLDRCAAVDDVGHADEETVRMWMTDPTLDPAEDLRVVEQGSELVGYVDLAHNEDRTRVYADARIDPAHRPIGSVGRLLLAFCEERAPALVAGGESGPPLLRAFALGPDATWVALLEERGFRAVRHAFQMRIELADEPPAPRWPEGVAVRSAGPGEERAVHAASEEGFADHWDFAPQGFERWSHHQTGSGHDPALWFLAVDGDEIAGVALCRAEAPGNPGVGWVDALAVRPPWRRRGIALALLHHAFRTLRARGATAAGLGVDAESVTGAVELYGRAGMYEQARTTTYEKPIAPPETGAAA